MQAWNVIQQACSVIEAHQQSLLHKQTTLHHLLQQFEQAHKNLRVLKSENEFLVQQLLEQYRVRAWHNLSRARQSKIHQLDKFLAYNFDLPENPFSRLVIPVLKKMAIPKSVELKKEKLQQLQARLREVRESTAQEIQREELKFQLLKMEYNELMEIIKAKSCL